MRNRIWYKVGTWNLKIFFSISLGIHLLSFLALTLLFTDLKIDRLPTLNIEVSLLPLVTEAKIASINANRKETLTSYGLRITSREENRLQRYEKSEEHTYKEDVESESPYSVQAIATDVLIEEQKPLPLENRKRETGDGKEPLIQSMSVHLPLNSVLTFEQEKSSKLSVETPLEKENLSISIPQSKISHTDLLPITDSPEGSKNIAYLPSTSKDGLSPKATKKVRPIYPQWAKEKGYQGEGILRVQLFLDGKVGRIEVKKSSGHEILDRCAIDAVKQWKFIPGSEWYWVNIPFKFEINENSIKNSPPLRDSRKR